VQTQFELARRSTKPFSFRESHLNALNKINNLHERDLTKNGVLHI